VWPCFFIIKHKMWSFVTPLRLKRAHIFLSNYLEQGSPRIDGLHFCLTDGSPIKKIHQNQKVWKRQKNDDDDDLVTSRGNKKENRCLEKKKRNGEHIRGKWIYDVALFKDHCSKIPSHLFEFLLSTFAFIPLALTTIQA